MSFNNTSKWSQEELDKLNLAFQLYSNLDKERCEYLHKHALPYKTPSEILAKSNELLKQKLEQNKSPVLKSSVNNQNNNNNQNVPKMSSPSLKPTVPSINNLNNNNNNNHSRSNSPCFWPNN